MEGGTGQPGTDTLLRASLWGPPSVGSMEDSKEKRGKCPALGNLIVRAAEARHVKHGLS